MCDRALDLIVSCVAMRTSCRTCLPIVRISTPKPFREGYTILYVRNVILPNNNVLDLLTLALNLLSKALEIFLPAGNNGSKYI